MACAYLHLDGPAEGFVLSDAATRPTKPKRGLGPAAAIGLLVGFLPPLLMEFPNTGDILTDVTAFAVRMLIGSAIGAAIGFSVALLGYKVSGRAR